MSEVWKKTPSKIQSNVAKQIFAEEANVEIKKNLALVIGEAGTNSSHIQMALVQALFIALGQSKPKMYRLHRLLGETLSETEEFETEEFNLIKQNLVKSIRETKPKDRKTQRILVDSLELFNSEKQADIRNEIYSFFEDIAKNITIKTARKLAAKIGKGISSEEKKHIIKILRKRNPKDALTIQLLGEGLNDPNPEIRSATVKTLGNILEILNPNSLKKIYKGYGSTFYSLFIYPIKNIIFDDSNTPNDIRLHILQTLIRKAQHDPEPLVQKAAIKAMVKINIVYAMVIDTLIEIISSNSDSEVEKEAISALKETLTNSFSRNVFHLSTHIVKERKTTIIKRLTRALYDKDQNVRKAARQAFKALYGKGKIALKSYYEIQESKAGELRKRIREYQITGKGLTYDNPNSQPANKVPPPFESWFEVEVFLKIHEEGYIVLPQYVHTNSEKGKDYRIDLAIVSSDKTIMSKERKESMLFIECDGPYHDKTERQKKDRERQRDLENEKWTVWRVKHSEEKNPSLPYLPFYSLYPNWKDRKINPEALKKLWEELERKEIEPVE
ncbi:MAG: hypothetical protein OXB86_07060 [Bdellovibrionales bacterium]|nr:hypothetical protein [Bdellovibrionales bacterium]